MAAHVATGKKNKLFWACKPWRSILLCVLPRMDISLLQKIKQAAEKNADAAAGTPDGIFTGQSAHSLDAHGRLVIPVWLYRQLGSPSHVFMMLDPVEKSLDILPRDEMEKLFNPVLPKPLLDPKLKKIFTMIGRFSECLALDKKRRIRIPANLLARAGISSKVVLVGALNRIKIWPYGFQPEETAQQWTQDLEDVFNGG